MHLNSFSSLVLHQIGRRIANLLSSIIDLPHQIHIGKLWCYDRLKTLEAFCKSVPDIRILYLHLHAPEQLRGQLSKPQSLPLSFFTRFLISFVYIFSPFQRFQVTDISSAFPLFINSCTNLLAIPLHRHLSRRSTALT